MIHRKKLHILLLPALLSVMVQIGCKQTPPASSSVPNSSPTPSSTQNSAIETEIVTPQAIAGVIAATGKILVPEDRVAVIGPVNEGRIVRLYAGQGTRVRKGQKLADLESADIDQAEADYLKALADHENARRSSAAEIKLAQENYDRAKLLFEQRITAGKNLQAAEHDLEVAKAAAENSINGTNAALIAARRHLLILGLKDSAIDSLSKRSDLASVFSLNSPIDGIVVERNATVGASVGTDANLFKIIDLSRVWIDANVFEKDLQQVRSGQEVKLTVPAFPGSTFSGRVILINSVVDPDTRTVKVRTEVANPDGRLKPDMFANVQIVTALNRTAISIPQSAVLNDDGKSVVFVAEGNGYKKRQVQPGIQNNDRVEIVDGLSAGDKVVVKGNYLLLQNKPGE
ncbi:MAG TPA: efflux RND transporter periplasmic adaptor subunit [Pyrinomonadaceae bacterium]|jgi:cobalt-zinc-cadmium efflux system membrane fusion protein|nr:efflux RND transporter periplasmic adaptor subunit [Pyrinomonadaceae bacterium]